MNKGYNDRIYFCYKKSLDLIGPIGSKIHDKYIKNAPTEIKICHDILYRIYCNLLTLLKIGPVNEHNNVAHCLLLRNIHGDLIIGFYLLTISDQERFNEIYKQNNEGLKSLEQWIISKKDYYDSLPNTEPLNIFINDFYSVYKEYVDPDKGKIKTDRSSKGTSLYQMSKNISISDWIAIRKYEQLYTNYRLLSLVEHYHPITRRYSYSTEQIKVIIEDCAKWMTDSIIFLCEISKEWEETGNFVVSH